MIDLISTPFVEALIYSLSVFGIYILFKILKFPDISADNVFAFGSMCGAYFYFLTNNFFVSFIVVALLGFLLGGIASLLNLKLRVPKLLVGIIIYSILFSINLKFFSRPNISLPQSIYSPIILCSFNLGCILTLHYLFNSNLGKSLIAYGSNPKVLLEYNAPFNLILFIGLGISDLLIATSGFISSIYFGFSDISIGVGVLINGVASIIFGEYILLYFGHRFRFIILFLGIYFYYLILYFIITYLSFGILDFNDYKLISGVIIALFFVLNRKKMKEIISFSV